MLFHQLHHLLADYGYWALAFLIGLESMGIPLPGETVLVAAAIHEGNRNGNIGLVIAAAAAGAIIGDNVGYFLGRELGFRFLLWFAPYVGLSDARIKLGQYVFLRHGGKVVFFGRFVAILRCLAAFLAGVNQMAWPRFLLANAAGGIVWATMIGFGGYLFGRVFHQIVGPLSLAAFVFATVAVVWGFIYLSRHEMALEEESEKAFPGTLRARRVSRLRNPNTF